MKHDFKTLSLIFRITFSVLLLTEVAQAQPAAINDSAPGLPQVGFSIIKTSKVAVLERLLLPDGSLAKKTDSNFSAFLIKHKDEYLLFDTGLGSQIEYQYEQDMPYWQRPFFRFDKPVRPARMQLDDAGFAPVQKVIVSHSHWDHASGVSDFPEAQIFVSQDELSTIANPQSGAGGTWASQVAAPGIKWNALILQPIAYKGYTQSLDLYGDGSVVLVAMPGHTTGSIGMFVTVDSGTCYFFIGDVAWKTGAVLQGVSKFWAASFLVDRDRAQTLRSVEQVRQLMQQNPGLVVVPAHDGAAQDRLGYFPGWIR
jgi:glyoxylase-like metal-dependent hydrolase (beta-lactamase superfamily II)